MYCYSADRIVYMQLMIKKPYAKRNKQTGNHTDCCCT
mgnify:CR=1 FL=1